MKDKIYYFQEKSNDILDLQDEFTPEEIGIYFILKAAYFKYSGELKEDNLCQRCKFFGDKDKLVAVSKKIFTVTEGSLVNNSWLSEINNIKERSKKRQDAANERWNPSKPEASGKQTRSKPEAIDDIKSQFEKIYKLYNQGKNIKVIPFDKLKAKFQNCLKEITFEELEQNIKDYLQYLSTAEWRKKKAFEAWINSPEFYANDWINEGSDVKTSQDPITNKLNQIAGGSYFKSVVIGNEVIITCNDGMKTKAYSLPEEIKNKIKAEFKQSIQIN